jgi:DNA-binding CsgD family transcriptional regulator
VLLWVTQGEGNYEIGVILGAQTRTICKHIFSKVSSRNQLIILLLNSEPNRSSLQSFPNID